MCLIISTGELPQSPRAMLKKQLAFLRKLKMSVFFWSHELGFYLFERDPAEARRSKRCCGA